jgi:peptide/nickel transport system permease protein
MASIPASPMSGFLPDERSAFRILTTPSLRYALGRVVQAPAVLLIVVVLQFFLLHLAPGDVADVIAGESQSADPQFVSRLRGELGLDRPLPVQLGLHIWRVVRLDLGMAHSFGAPVTELIVDRLPATVLLTLSAIAAAFVVGMGLGMFAALGAHSAMDVTISILALLFYATPAFLVGIGLILIFTVQLGWLPMSGMGPTWGHASWWQQLLDTGRHLLMPMVSLSLFYVAVYTRLMRAAVLEVVNQDYIRTARAKGLMPVRIIWVHMARNAVLPMVTMLGLQVGSLLGGSILVETVFGWPGIGRLAFEAVFRRDVPLMMGILFFSSLLVLAVSLLIDLIYTRLDPRIVLR